MADHDHRLPTDTDDGMLLIISGPSGVGKTTITRAIERSIPGAVFSVSATTRVKAPSDVEGVDYHFVSDEEFERMKAAGDFIETAGVYGKKYGTPRTPVMEQMRRGRLMILEIDVQGAIQIKRQIPLAFGILILPPDEATLLHRLRDRKRDSEEAILRRFAAAKQEIAAGKASGIYDVHLINDRLDDAIDRALQIVTDVRSQRAKSTRSE
jgi:guanylate kinase